jgi:hypothetical protein
MPKQYFSLEISENNNLTKIIRIIFGITCLVVSIFWLKYNIKLLKSDGTLWITIVFLSGFGFYQIASGVGYTRLFIDIEKDRIRLKKNALLPVKEIMPENLEKIQLFALNVIFVLKSGKKINLRFGTTYPEMIENVKEALVSFAESNNNPLEFMSEEL